MALEIMKQTVNLLGDKDKVGHVIVVRLLPDARIEVNGKDFIGSTPLSFTTENRHKRVVGLLLEDEKNLIQIQSTLMIERPYLFQQTKLMKNTDSPKTYAILQT